MKPTFSTDSACLYLYKSTFFSFSHLNSIWFVFYVRNALFFAVSLVWKLCTFRNCLTFCPIAKSMSGNIRRQSDIGYANNALLLHMQTAFWVLKLETIVHKISARYKLYSRTWWLWCFFFCVFHSLLVCSLASINFVEAMWSYAIRRITSVFFSLGHLKFAYFFSFICAASAMYFSFFKELHHFFPNSPLFFHTKITKTEQRFRFGD